MAEGGGAWGDLGVKGGGEGGGSKKGGGGGGGGRNKHLCVSVVEGVHCACGLL